VSAETIDSSGRTSTLAGPVVFTIDNHAPVVAFVSPMEGKVITEGTHTVVASAIDETFPVEEGSVHLSIDMGAWVALIAVDGDFEFVWDTSGLSDGEHNLRVQAEDMAGHISGTAINVIVDNHDPDVAVVAPTAGQYVTGPLNFQVAAGDARDIVEVTLDWGVGEPVTATVNAATNYYEYSLDTTTLADDTYELTATALDGSGRTTQVTVTFQVDNHEPVLTFDGPLTGEILDGEVTVSAGVSDAFVDSLQFSVDGVGWVDMVDGEGTFDSTRFADGLHTIMVRAVDGSGKVTSASSEVTIDNTAPIISVADFPSLDAHVAGELDFGLFADDAVGVESVIVTTWDDTWNVYLNPATGFYEWTMDTTMFEDGFHDLEFTAFDEAGHDSSLAWSVYVDNTAPLVTSMKPKEGDTVEGTVKFEWVLIDDTAVDWVRIRIGRGVWQEMTDQENGIYVYEWETTSKDDVDALDITVRYADTLGNIEDAEMQVTVDNPMNWTVVGMFIGLVLLIVFMLFFLRRRMRDDEDAEGGETSYGEGDLEVISIDKDLDDLLNPDGNPNGSQSQMERPPIDADTIDGEVEDELKGKRRK
jgi:hypothetical protein